MHPQLLLGTFTPAADSSGLPPLLPKLQRYPTIEPLSHETRRSAGSGETPLAAESVTSGSVASAVTRPAAAQLGVLKLAALTFFAVAGGPFGVEPLVRTGGPGWTVLGLLGVPYIWGLPMAMMTAELSTAIPESGGYILWIQRAFGDFWATQARYDLSAPRIKRLDSCLLAAFCDVLPRQIFACI